MAPAIPGCLRHAMAFIRNPCVCSPTLLLHIAYSGADAAARLRFAFGQSSHAAFPYVFEIHREKSHQFSRVGRSLSNGGRLHLREDSAFAPMNSVRFCAGHLPALAQTLQKQTTIHSQGLPRCHEQIQQPAGLRHHYRPPTFIPCKNPPWAFPLPVPFRLNNSPVLSNKTP